MKFLALDTSTEACSVALALDGQILALDEVCPQQHSKRILPMLQQLLSDAGVSLYQLDGIIFGRGPGSFTGVRIGVSVAQGLAFGADLPVFGVSTLAAMAQAAAVQQNATEVIAAIDARMAEVYIAAYALDEAGLMQAITPEIAAKPAALPEVLTSLSFTSQVLGVGTGWQTYPQALQQLAPALIADSILYPSAQFMLPFASRAWQQQLFVSAEQAEPVYVRDEVTWQKLPGR
ncbi:MULTISPECIES: tRNA (adenosine(37)-N6)-threonylcarbamoyltransferase complex dimerization subunit type 1 TsaB [unclassified Alishewanella]|uniref:tRNA (adenosine(37)-N6)-threonylcarbamoyltransferase complex dimerization subunit type 1 TsaB n=1 Tax=unclassified Alishewanella TaxID=2628974 RepID=UPI0008237335|nr:MULTISPECIES: tRNA (adenosine(37)-N6)-threonylcarbamoyltransferase complex dimerization subunit type 1 TsaB [unclassified Alishewanella]MCT8126648.1 tRNA (adenosine(37)-N6)-threonylcarbamoyltransferase complex dimerization subunit type 1 TsaB [Alishewanella sp. BS5-314]OCW96107.1 tRNA N6-adenosine(37)-N6-threonylcarbamoyltransferase complex dimerization subunit TsaB [Alishewanella sp. HH-ZS]